MAAEGVQPSDVHVSASVPGSAELDAGVRSSAALERVPQSDGEQAEPGTEPVFEKAEAVEQIVALLGAYDAGPPSADELREASPDPESVLVALSEDEGERPAIRQAATRSLGTVGGELAGRRLLELLSDAGGDAGMRRAAVQGAEPLLSDQAALVAAVEAVLRDPAPAVARAAVLSLGEVPSARHALEALDAEEVPPQVKTALDEVLRGGTVVAPPSATKVEPTRERSPGRR